MNSLPFGQLKSFLKIFIGVQYKDVKIGQFLSGAARHLFPVHKRLLAEQEGNAPKTCQPNDGVNDPAEQCAGAAEEPGHQIKPENAYQPPVDTADDGQNKRKGIHILTSISH